MPTLTITASKRFGQAGLLTGNTRNIDPRDAGCGFEEVTIDLRQCVAIRPAATFWCLIFALQVMKSRASCQLLVPEEPRAAIYLNPIGLFRCLEEFDVSIIGEHLDRTNRDQIMLPLTNFGSDFDAEKVTNVIYERLDELKLITSNIKSTIIETFGELTNNATQHANSSIASYQDDSFRQLHNRAEHSFAL